MSGTLIIFRREVGQYFSSLFAYLIAASFLLLTALPFNYDLAASAAVKPPSPAVIPNFLAFALVFFAPVLTMRMLSEENREGTLELLLTAPVSLCNPYFCSCTSRFIRTYPGCSPQ
jgi:ABC-2 type transport system permease protein